MLAGMAMAGAAVLANRQARRAERDIRKGRFVPPVEYAAHLIAARAGPWSSCKATAHDRGLAD